jgi:multicomponent Na+:H+ antiporter subunit G
VNDIFTAVLMAIGGAFMLLAAVGILRLPDTYTRLQAATKAVTLGVSSMLLGAAVHFADLHVTVRAITTVLFLLVTAPIAGHLIGRVAHLLGIRMSAASRYDDLREHRGDLSSRPPAAHKRDQDQPYVPEQH